MTDRNGPREVIDRTFWGILHLIWDWSEWTACADHREKAQQQIARVLSTLRPSHLCLVLEYAIALDTLAYTSEEHDVLRAIADGRAWLEPDDENNLLIRYRDHVEVARTVEDEDVRPQRAWDAAVEAGITVTDFIDSLKGAVPDSPKGLPTLKRSKKVQQIVAAYGNGRTVADVDSEFKSYFGDPDILAGAYFVANSDDEDDS